MVGVSHSYLLLLDFLVLVLQLQEGELVVEHLFFHCQNLTLQLILIIYNFAVAQHLWFVSESEVEKQGEHLLIFVLVCLVRSSLVLQVVEQCLDCKVKRVRQLHLQNTNRTLLFYRVRF